MLSLLGKLKEKLTKTRQNLFGRISAVLQGKTILDEALLSEIEEILITADIGVQTAHKILERTRQRVKKEKISEVGQIYRLLEEEIENLIIPVAGKPLEEKMSDKKPFVLLIVGVNGTGKTTTIGKLANRFAQTGKKVLMVAGDTFRAAASNQLEIWARRSEVDIIRQNDGADPSAVIFDAMQSATTGKYDVVLIDTAGRLHTKVNLMEELKKMRRVIEKHISGAPHETILVLDGTTGQNAIQQARQFSQAVQVSGLILTKLDGTAKGGVVLAIQQELKIPVLYIGVGEGIDDLEAFDPHAFIQAIVE
ncbi:signal recognition particle-docking protein FtsY [bacterium]|nr:signal recognition particle-docking protein FtsY [bacterium]NUN44626.1 signal recognition particle-docking protein FtsY [bacterium]